MRVCCARTRLFIEYSRISKIVLCKSFRKAERLKIMWTASSVNGQKFDSVIMNYTSRADARARGQSSSSSVVVCQRENISEQVILTAQATLHPKTKCFIIISTTTTSTIMNYSKEYYSPEERTNNRQMICPNSSLYNLFSIHKM